MTNKTINEDNCVYFIPDPISECIYKFDLNKGCEGNCSCKEIKESEETKLPQNQGKIFENSFKDSFNKEMIYYQRINDPAQSFNQQDSLRFSLQNPYDCYAYIYPNLLTLELKSTESTSMSFWREDFVDKTKKQTFMVKKNQIAGLLKSSKYRGIISGLILNFRKTNHTYFLHIDDFIIMTKDMDKKSFNEQDVFCNNGYIIGQALKKVKYNYGVQKFIEEMQVKYN